MKKLISVALCMMVAITCAYAAPSPENNAETNTFYIMSKECPDEYVEYATENIGRFIYGNDNYDVSEVDTFMLGGPFSFSQSDANIFYFPVYADGEFLYLLRVYSAYDGEIYGVLSTNLVSEIKSLSGETSFNQPMYLNMTEGDIIATVNGVSTTLYSYPEGIYVDNPQHISATDENSTEELDVEEITPKVTFTLPTYNSPRALTSRYLNLFVGKNGYYLETQQSGQEWCAAYASAAIMRYVAASGSIPASVKARDIMEYFYGSDVSNSDSINPVQIVQFANFYGLRPLYEESSLTSEKLIKEMTFARPTYMGMRNTAGSFRHAVVLRGFDSNAQTYSIWNPWYTDYETYPMGGIYSPDGDSSLQLYHYRTIYNFSYNLYA